MLHRVASVGTWMLLAVAVVALLALGLGPRTGRYRTLTVLSGSMTPTFRAGDSVIATPTPLGRLRAGDVIVYRIPVEDRRVVSHRIVSIDRSHGNPTVVTKGDANDVRDAWTAQLQGSRAWVVRGHVPKGGVAVHALRGRAVQWASLAALGLAAVMTLWRVWVPSTRQRSTAQSPTSSGAAPRATQDPD